MEDDNDSDFTFCRVEAPLGQNGSQSQEADLDMSSIKIKDEASICTSSDQTSSYGSGWNGRFPMNGPKQEERVGSLSFSVTNATPQKQPSPPPSQATSVGSVKASSDQKSITRKPKARTKVPFEKGYSQMDWFKLTRTYPDLAGLKGQSNKRLIKMSEVKQHQTGDALWTVLKGHVYNIAPYMKFHPGGVDLLMKAVGKDCTSLFNKYHAWVNSDFLLEKCLVGILDDSH